MTPVSLERSLQRFGKLFRLECQAFFYGLFYDCLVSFINFFQVTLLYVGMIYKGICHLSRSGPHIFMRKGWSVIKGLFPVAGKICEDEIFLNLEGLLDKVACLIRYGYTVFFGEKAYFLIHLLIQ